MYRFIPAAVVLALGLVLGCADDKKDAKALTPSEILDELKEKLEDADDKEKRTTLLETYSKKFLAYAEENKDDKGVEALFYILLIPGKDDKGSPKANAIALLKDHAKTTKLGKSIKKLQMGPENTAVRAALLDFAEHNKDKASQVYAYRSLIKLSEMAAGFADRVKDDEELKEKIEKSRGKGYVKRILDVGATSEKDIKAYKAKLDGDLNGIFLDLSVGKAAPEINSLDLDGKKVKLSDLKGKVVVLDFWATWCGPCRLMIPHTRELVKKMDGKPFVFVSVSADEKKETLTKFIKDTPMPWTHWHNGTAGVVEDWEIDAFPTIYILDTKGIIRKVIIGGDSKLIDAEVEKLVQEIEDKKAK